MNIHKALLIGQNQGLMRSIPDLLARAGFKVSVVATFPIVRRIRSIEQAIFIGDPAYLPQACADICHDYALVVIADDDTLKLIVDSGLTTADKLKLLPVTGTEHFSHLFSKIGLSLNLRQHGINTPDFCIAYRAEELKECCDRVGYPVLIKVNASYGGQGIFECKKPADVAGALEQLTDFPLLVQRKLCGVELDLSGFYRDGQLIHFSYSVVAERYGHRFGPSKLRNYTQLGAVEAALFDELAAVGRALGIHGFANLACIQAADDGKRYYFEADLRPTVWCDYPKYFGDDPALPIAAFFTEGKILAYPYPLNPSYASNVKLPYFLRMRLWELLINRYGVWRYIDWSGFFQLRAIFGLKLISVFEQCLIQPLRIAIPRGLRSRLAAIYLGIKQVVIERFFHQAF